MTRRLRKPARPGRFSAWFRSVRAARQAGTMATRMPASGLTPRANRRTPGSRRTSSRRGNSPGARDLRMATPGHARNAPATPPASDRIRLSAIRCLAMRARPAPSAARTAISLDRDVTRTRSKFARFAHAMRSRANTATDSTESGVRIGAIRRSRRGSMRMETEGRSRHDVHRRISRMTWFASTRAASTAMPGRRRAMALASRHPRQSAVLRGS